MIHLLLQALPTTQPATVIVSAPTVDSFKQLVDSVTLLLSAAGTVLGVLAMIFHRGNAKAIQLNASASAAHETELAKVAGIAATASAKVDTGLTNAANGIKSVENFVLSHQATAQAALNTVQTTATQMMGQVADVQKAITAVSLATPVPPAPKSTAPAVQT
jgi:hypothetical protein